MSVVQEYLEELELLRRIYCDRDAIIGWFLQLSSLFHRPVELMFNMDETYITAKKNCTVSLPVSSRT